MNLSPGTMPSPLGIPTPTTQAPLHDIVGPFDFLAYTRTQILVACFLFLMLLSLLVWGFRKLRQKRALTPQEIFLETLATMKQNIMQGEDAAFGSRVSGILRDYLGMAFALAAPRQTTEEFLESVRGHEHFSPAEQESLQLFLTRSDFLKFAHGSAAEEDRLALILAAEEFVQRGVATEPKIKEAQGGTTR